MLLFKKNILLPALILFTHLSYSQITSVKAILPGSKVPDIPFILHTGDSITQVFLSDFKGKMVLFDFWATSCSDCIASMPKLLAFQKQFGQQIKIIEVASGSWQNPEALKLFWKKMEGHVSRQVFEAARQLPFIMADSVIGQMFVHDGNGWTAWIDKDGIFRGMGTSLTLTNQNVTAFLKGTEIEFEMKRRESMLDFEKPLTWMAESDNNYYAFFTNHLVNGGLWGSSIMSKAIILKDSITGDTTGIAALNTSIVDLYKLAYNERYHLNKDMNSAMTDDQVLVRVKNKSRLLAPSRHDNSFIEWTNNNTYCYASKMNPSIYINPYDRLILDLDNYFNIQSSVENIKIKCLILKRTSDEYKIKTKGGQSLDYVRYTGDDSVGVKVSRNYPFYSITQTIQNILFFNMVNDRFPTIKPYLVNESGYSNSDEIDIDLPNWYSKSNVTLPEMQFALRKYGLDLTEEYRPRKVLILSDRIGRLKHKISQNKLAEN